MKKAALVSILLAGSFLIKAQAQVSVNVQFNVGSQPNWGPTGYDNVNYYYMPDIDVYYYVPEHHFIYFFGGRWVVTASLPQRCHDYDLYRGYKVVINEPRPYRNHGYYRSRYAHYRNYYGHQTVLRDHRNKHDDDGDGPGNGHGNGHAYGHDKDHGGHGKKGH
jgi:hypothetical protein